MVRRRVDPRVFACLEWHTMDTKARCRADVDTFFQQCHPDRDNLCLYGMPRENGPAAPLSFFGSVLVDLVHVLRSYVACRRS